MSNTPAVALRCDAGGALGIGHLIRSLALAEELLGRGCAVEVRGSVVDSPFALGQIRARGLALLPAAREPEEFALQCVEAGYGAVVLDGYEIDTATGAALRAAGIRVLSVHDGSWGLGQDADVYLDQNLGATPPVGVAAEAVVLAGAEYTCFRDSVVSRRAEEPRVTGDPPQVLAFFGGTDVFEAAPVLVPLILATGLPAHIHAVAARPDLARAIQEAVVGPGQSVEVHALVPDLPGLAVRCDAAVSAAGTSTWEMLCLGVPTGLVAVTANQLVGYDEVIGRDIASPIGLLEELRVAGPARDRAVSALARLVGDDAYRQGLSSRGMALFDGRGRRRVADALLGAH